MQNLKKALSDLFKQISDFVGGKGGSDSTFAKIVALLKGLLEGLTGEGDKTAE